MLTTDGGAVWSLLCWLYTLLWPGRPHYVPCAPFRNISVQSVPLHIGSISSFFYFDFTGVTVKITALSLKETLNFVLLNNAETGRLWRLLKLVWFLHYAMATSP